MARVAALVPDLLFGSKVQAALRQAGHDVQLLTSEPSDYRALADLDVLVVDLTTNELDSARIAQALKAGGGAGVRTLGFFAHVQPEVRERALRSGFDQVVPRSRMAREGAELVGRLAAG
jgi:CheY-like chemotaxis protein